MLLVGGGGGGGGGDNTADGEGGGGGGGGVRTTSFTATVVTYGPIFGSGGNGGSIQMQEELEVIPHLQIRWTDNLYCRGWWWWRISK